MNTITENSDSLSKFIKVFDDALTDEQCDTAIKYFDDNEEKAALAEVYGGRVATDVRNVMELPVEFDSEVDGIFQKSCGELLQRYSESVDMYPMNATSDFGYSVNKYFQGEHFYEWHSDTLPDFQRTATLLWYLNDVDEGGETEFMFGMKVKPKKGHAVIFPSNFCFAHRGNIPVSNPKYIGLAFIGNTPG